MLIKLSSKNQVTVPRRLLAELPSTKYFEVELENGALVMKPVELVETKLEQIQRKMTDLGLKCSLRNNFTFSTRSIVGYGSPTEGLIV
jgi:hypothetical protein